MNNSTTRFAFISALIAAVGLAALPASADPGKGKGPAVAAAKKDKGSQGQGQAGKKGQGASHSNRPAGVGNEGLQGAENGNKGYDKGNKGHPAKEQAQKDEKQRAHQPMARAAKQEHIRHSRRVAQLARISTLAEQDGRDDLVALAAKLLEKENTRHDRWLGKYQTQTERHSSKK